MKFRDLVRRPVYEQVAERIREAIVRGEFTPGQPLPAERDLAQSFAVGRTSIREALQLLRAEGLLLSKGPPPSRPVVADVASGPLRDVLLDVLQLQRVSLKDLVEFRYVLESAAVERAASDPDPEGLEQAREAVRAMRGFGPHDEGFDAVDVRFHLALMRASGNEMMYRVMGAVRMAMAHHLFEALRALRERPGGLEVIVREHEEILEAVERGDGPLASRLTREHVVDFYQVSIEGLAPLDGPGADG